mmetsp:Transcript_14604/g.27594  ORF Transcript_14604/g.27594 Transcript_14604/m.27594 type:complete len:219 (+) Transcript_14604:277-933(+)
MTACCLFGVCIPYSAIVPLCLIGIQWVASKLADFGLLPDFLVAKLGLQNGKSFPSAEEIITTSDGGCCPSGTCHSTAATDTDSTSDGDDDNLLNGRNGSDEAKVQNVDSLELWNRVFSAYSKSPSSTLIVKFTAEWCKPCHAIQPTYLSLASKYSSSKRRIKFITLDVDGEECDSVSSQYRVALMPTFVCIKGGKEVDRIAGGGGENKLMTWVAKVCS